MNDRYMAFAAGGAALAIAAALTARPAGAPASLPPAPRHTPVSCAGFAPLTALAAVTAISSRDAWAVGWSPSRGTVRALAVHWNGTSWTRVPGPGGPRSHLFGVTATSARNAWAVGDFSGRALIERWNGAAWATVAAPGGSGSGLDEVAATSARNAWAVGVHITAGQVLPVIDRWNGTVWQQVSSPLPAGTSGGALFGLAATSPSQAWAVGYTFHRRQPSRTWTERWNGTTWRPVPSPSRGSGQNVLNQAAATSAASAWAVGYYYNSADQQEPLAEHWNGTAWAVVPSPPGSPDGGFLGGVSATSQAGAWAVGASCTRSGTHRTLIERWNGTAWTRVPSPNAAGARDSYLTQVTTVSAGNAWAVGWSSSGMTSQLLIEHWNGHAWEIMPIGRK